MAKASASPLEIPYFLARFSAVTPMGVPVWASVREAHRQSWGEKISCSKRVYS